MTGQREHEARKDWWTPDEWVCGYVLNFTDGGEPEAQVLHVGSREDCERAAELLPAVAYSGDRPGVSAHIVVRPVYFGIGTKP